MKNHQNKCFFIEAAVICKQDRHLCPYCLFSIDRLWMFFRRPSHPFINKENNFQIDIETCFKCDFCSFLAKIALKSMFYVFFVCFCCMAVPELLRLFPNFLWLSPNLHCFHHEWGLSLRISNGRQPFQMIFQIHIIYNTRMNFVINSSKDWPINQILAYL